ncbi:hypothetical protein FAGKG844_360002 [Frankia sp. AgKG'84/4]
MTPAERTTGSSPPLPAAPPAADPGRPAPGWVGVVTGAASGIGRAVAHRFAAAGGKVVGGDIDEAGLASLAAELPADSFAAARCDITVEDDVAALIALAHVRFGRLDAVVANAGGGSSSEVADHDAAEWRRVVDLCLNGTFLTVKHGGRALRDAGHGGSIVTIASLNAVQPGRGMGAYCAAKAGVVALTEVAALELGRHGIRVNAIAPGLTRTGATGPCGGYRAWSRSSSRTPRWAVSRSRRKWRTSSTSSPPTRRRSSAAACTASTVARTRSAIPT